MKLANKYKNEYEKYKVDKNKFYLSFEKQIMDEIYSTVPDAEELNVKIVNDKLESDISVKDSSYFEESFILLQENKAKIRTDTNVKIPEKLESRVSTKIDNVLDFIYKDGHILLLTGKKGWGKTTFLRYISRYIIPELNMYKDSEGKLHNKPCMPIYISFNTHINNFIGISA